MEGREGDGDHGEGRGRGRREGVATWASLSMSICSTEPWRLQSVAAAQRRSSGGGRWEAVAATATMRRLEGGRG